MVGEQFADAGRGVGEGVLVGGQHLGGTEPAHPFEGVELVAERVGDGGVVGVLVEADVRGDLGEEVVAGEQPAVAALQLLRVLLLQVQADMPRRVPHLGKIKELIGYEPKVGLQEIIERVVADFRSRLNVSGL